MSDFLTPYLDSLASRSIGIHNKPAEVRSTTKITWQWLGNPTHVNPFWTATAYDVAVRGQGVPYPPTNTRAQKVALLINIQKLINSNFNLDEVSCILAGSDTMSISIQNAVTQLCIHLQQQEHKSNEYIVHFVRRGRNDSNRTSVVNDFLRQHSL